MTLSRVVSAGSLIIVALLAGSALGGNQRQAHADIPPGLGTEIVCRVFTELNEAGPPIPLLPGNCQNPPGSPPQCRDGIDNDNDGLVDLNDPGCSDEDDNNEFNPPPGEFACSNGIDDDGDGFTDADDPNCHTDGDADNADSYDPNDDDEGGDLPACRNGEDDDGDGKTDFPADPGCSSATDNDETDPTGGGGGGDLPQCSNNIDDDEDGLIDEADPDCHTDGDADNPESYDPEDDSESAAACSDGEDNDGDGKTDHPDDPGCTDANDNDETDPSPGGGGGGGTHLCEDGIDNDGDGKIDFPDDPGCSTSSDDDETDPSSGGGGDGGSGGGGGGGSGSAIATQVNPGLGGTGGGSDTGGQVLGTTTCEAYVNGFMRIGQANNPGEVTKLQVFLNVEMGLNIPVTGFFGPETDAAVRAFQQKYASDILAPWGITEPTGYVYLTTRKKINEIYCARPFPLTAAEQAIIDASRAAGGQTSGATQSPGTGSPAGNGSATGTDDEEPGDVMGTTSTSTGILGEGNQFVLALVILLLLLGAGGAWYYWRSRNNTALG